MNTLLWILALQGLLGALDVLINHEWREGLPRRPGARCEQAIHGVRELLYALVFVALAWWELHGALAWLFGAVIGVEIALTGWDFVEEDRSRILPATERLMHLALSMLGGVYCTLLLPVLLDWAALPTALQRADHGLVSWLLGAMSLGVFGWGLRDLLAARRLFALSSTIAMKEAA